MTNQLAITITIDRDIGITADFTVDKGITLLELKKRLAACDPTGDSEVSEFGLGLSSAGAGQAAQPLPDDTRLTEAHRALDLCQLSLTEATPGVMGNTELHPPAPHDRNAPPGSCPTGGGSLDAAREAARQAAKKAQAARREREAVQAKANAEADAQKKAEAEAARQRWQAKAQAQAGVQVLRGGVGLGVLGRSPPVPSGPVSVPPTAAPSLFGAAVVEDTGETKVKGVSVDGKYVFAYVGDLHHPLDVIALIELFKAESSVEDLAGDKTRFVYAGGTRDRATSVEVQREVIIETTGLQNGDYELASFAHNNLKKQLNSHLTKQNCVVMFAGKAVKIVAQYSA